MSKKIRTPQTEAKVPGSNKKSVLNDIKQTLFNKI